MEFSISGLRVLGIIFSIIIVTISFLYFRGARWDRTTFLLTFLVGLGILVISSFPGSLDWLAGTLDIPKDNRGRLIGLIVISVFGLFALYLNQIARINSLKLSLDRTIRAASLKTSQPMNQALIDQSKNWDALVIIPAYNEQESLKELLPQIPAKIDGFHIGVAVIDDGSNDDTAEVARKQGVIVVSNLFNRGQGGASRAGYDLAKLLSVKACVTMDADLQHRPSDLSVLLNPILKDNYDLIIGSRRLGSAIGGSRIRSLGIDFLSRLVSILTGQRFTDVSSGYKAFRIDSLNSLSFHEDQFQAPEVLIASKKKGLRIKEVPIIIGERLHGATKKGSEFNYGIRFIRSIVRAWWVH